MDIHNAIYEIQASFGVTLIIVYKIEQCTYSILRYAKLTINMKSAEQYLKSNDTQYKWSLSIKLLKLAYILNLNQPEL